MKTLYISDLDGTLLDKNAKLTDFSVNILNKVIGKGNLFTYATARTFASAFGIMERVNINVPVILMNGVLIYDTVEDRYVNTEAIGEDAAKKIAGLFKKHSIYAFMYSLKPGKKELEVFYEKLATPHMVEIYNERKGKIYKVFEQTESLEKSADDTAVYVTACGEHDTLSPLNDEINELLGVKTAFYEDVYEKGQWYLEVFSSNASKYNSAQFLRNYTGADILVGFGDNYNDLPLFKACDKCFAVKNACDTLKEAADEIIDSNMENGVALWLHNNIL